MLGGRAPARARRQRGGLPAVASRLVQDALGGRRADAGQQLQHPEAGHPVARVLREAQDREHVLDVRRLEELQPAELHEGDVAPGELQLELGAVVRGPEQHRLLFSGMPASRAASTSEQT